MFTECFADENCRIIMDGVMSCPFRQSEYDLSHKLNVKINPSSAEILFCIKGEIKLTEKNGNVITIKPQEIFILSDCTNLAKAEIISPVEGVCLLIRYAQAQKSIKNLCHIYSDLPVSMEKVNEKMHDLGGFYRISFNPWSQSAFNELNRIAPENQGQYCAIKSFELIYLICLHCSGSYAMYHKRFSQDVEKYILDNLDNKLTIEELSRRFGMSSTAFKAFFRQEYGLPVHSWIQQKRMERAAALLKNTDISVLNIAQDVGYNSISQFNLVFKRTFDFTPTEYRKMSFSTDL